MTVEVANESGVKIDETRIARLASHVLTTLRMHPLAELSVLFVDDETMGKLHAKWMDESGPTDVLAFPMDELRPVRDGSALPEPGLLGDVVVCPQVAVQQAESAGHGHADELDLLCTHGILHLLGYDHAEPAAGREMFGLQNELLTAWKRSGSGEDRR